MNKPLEHYEILGYAGPGDSPNFDHNSLNWSEAPLLDISATFICYSIKNDLSVSYLLAEKVED
ncbi:MAG: hypothetical protein P8O16_17010 [Algoriphagus sp.]|uniref:hypothetical protein n=1 Tax=Algoriphagus sp. TaxID=1872435 RepID=UPI002613EB07|nr:hypothetical protein [Algoriphagus sp.]MDG1278981.1 hypothetical protein [Algoriphagus sp.]